MTVSCAVPSTLVKRLGNKLGIAMAAMEITAISGFMYKRTRTANTIQMTESKMEIRFCNTFSSMIEKFWLNAVTYDALPVSS